MQDSGGATKLPPQASQLIHHELSAAHQTGMIISLFCLALSKRPNAIQKEYLSATKQRPYIEMTQLAPTTS
jgi:hypothetical protein